MNHPGASTIRKQNALNSAAIAAAFVVAASLPFAASAQEADCCHKAVTATVVSTQALNFEADQAGAAYQPRQDRKNRGYAAFDTSTHESGLVGKIRRKLRRVF